MLCIENLFQLFKAPTTHGFFVDLIWADWCQWWAYAISRRELQSTVEIFEWHTLFTRYIKTILSQHINMSDMRFELPATRLFVQQLVQANNKGDIKASHYCRIATAIHWWPVNSPWKGPVTRKTLRCYDVTMALGRFSTIRIISENFVARSRYLKHG